MGSKTTKATGQEVLTPTDWATWSAVRWASDMIEIIGLTPGAVGNARGVADPHALRVVQLAAAVGDRRRRVRAHPAGTHLVRGEAGDVERAVGRLLDAAEEGIEVVAPAASGRDRRAA